MKGEGRTGGRECDTVGRGTERGDLSMLGDYLIYPRVCYFVK